MGPLRDAAHVEVGSPLGGYTGILGSVINKGAHLAKIGVGGNHWLHHRADGSGTTESVRRVDDTEHALCAVVGNGAVEEGGVGIVDNLLEDEVLQLDTRGEGSIGGLVARSELRALGNGVVVSTPDELDGIADGSVDGEGNVTENTLGRSDPDDMSLSGLGGRLIDRREGRVAGLALLNAIIIRVLVPPGVASRTVGRGRGRLGPGAASRVGRRRLVGRGRGAVPGIASVLVGGGRLILGGVAVPVAILGGKGSRGSPGAWLLSWRRVNVRSGQHPVAVPGIFDQTVEWEGVSDRILTTRRYQTGGYRLERRPQLHCQGRNPRARA